jgi:hypothetical protein
MKTQFNCRLSTQTLDTINTLAAALECSQADVIRQAVRLLARREAVPPREAKTPGETKQNKR